jgi:hypothetical protein
VAYQFANVLEHDLKIHKSSSSQNETKGKALASYICHVHMKERQGLFRMVGGL